MVNPGYVIWMPTQKLMLQPGQRQQNVKVLEINIDEIVESQRRIIDLTAGASLNQQLSNETDASPKAPPS